MLRIDQEIKEEGYNNFLKKNQFYYSLIYFDEITFDFIQRSAMNEMISIEMFRTNILLCNVMPLHIIIIIIR